MRFSAKILALSLFLSVSYVLSQTVDLTRSPGAAGAEVVEAVLDILRKSCIFPDDNSFLRRVAFVDSADGRQNFTYRAGYYGGIWQIDEATFVTTQNAPSLANYRQEIASQLAINWTTVKWEELRKPLYSGIAAELALLFNLNGKDAPVTVENQAALWAANLSDANTFFTLVNKLNLVRTTYSDVDVVFVLDSSSSLSMADFDNTKEFVKKVIDGFDVDGDKVNVAVVEYSSVPKLIFGLDNNMTQAGVLAEVDRMSYMPGGTATSDALKFVRDSVFTNGGRQGSSKIVVLVTDGRSNDKVSTITAANVLKISGVTIFAVGVGSLVDKTELGAVASSPGCIYLKTVSNFTELPSVNYEIQQLSLKAAVNLQPGTYSFDCDSNINVRIASDKGGDRTIEVTSQDGSVNIFGSGSSSYTPNSAIFTFNDTATGASTVQFYVRDKSEVYLAFRNGTLDGCKSRFQVKVSIGDHIKIGNHVTCIENGLISTCSPKDLILSPFVITGTPEPALANLCAGLGTGNAIFSHPLSLQKYIYCSGGIMLIIYCPQGERFNTTLSHCVYSPSANIPSSTTKATTSKPITAAPNTGHVTTSSQHMITDQPATNPPVTNPPATVAPSTGNNNATIRPPNTGTSLVNPCTPENILNGNYFFAYPLDNTSYIHCDMFPYTGAIQQCPPHKYYDPNLHTCLYAEVVVPNPTNATQTYSNLDNPCIKNFQGDVQYHPYPGDPHRFIQCDAFGDAFVKTCDMGEIWEQKILNCIPNGFRYQTKNPGLVGK